MCIHMICCFGLPSLSPCTHPSPEFTPCSRTAMFHSQCCVDHIQDPNRFCNLGRNQAVFMIPLLLNATSNARRKDGRAPPALNTNRSVIQQSILGRDVIVTFRSWQKKKGKNRVVLPHAWFR